jgi:hypothetical protein
VIGELALTIEPNTCTELALSAAALAAEMICEGVFDATPLLELELEAEEEELLEPPELPQPPSRAPTITSVVSVKRGSKRGSRRPKMAQILADVLVGHALTGKDRAQDGDAERRTQESDDRSSCV